MLRREWFFRRWLTRSSLALGLVALALSGLAGSAPLVRAQATAAPARAPQATVPVSGVLPVGTTTWTAGNVYLVTGSVTVPANATLIVQPGAIVKFQYDAGLEVNGALQAGGAGQPVIWTSFLDDTYGGDTDGTTVAPQPGNWFAINLNAGCQATISNAYIAYGGGNYWYYDSKALIRSYSSNVTLDHVTLTKSGYAGLYAEKANVQVNACTISDNAYYYGLHYSGLDATQPLTVTNNVFSQTAGYGGLIRFTGLPSGPITFRGNRATGGRCGFTVWGDMRSDLTWDNGSDLALLPGGLSVGVTATLRLMPGTVAKLYDSVVEVKGALIAEGTGAAPIAITSINDDAHGGDTNANGGATAPAIGDWQAINFSAGSQGRISNAFIAYGGGNYYYYDTKALVRSWTSDLTFDLVTLQQSANHGLYTGDAGPRITSSNIISMTGRGIQNSTPGTKIVLAMGNYWGDPSGPYSATANRFGKGTAVSSGVFFYPWESQFVRESVQVRAVSVQIEAPQRASPGQTVDYAVAYANATTRTVPSAVLVLVLPSGALYADATDGGIYWPERHQVFWKLGDLPTGSEGIVAAKVTFLWGLANGTQDQVMALLGGTGVGILDVPSYLAYTPITVAARTPLSDDQILSERTTYRDVDLIYRRAISDGLTLLGGSRVTLNEGSTATEIVLAQKNTALFLRREGSQVLATTIGPDVYAVCDATGGLTLSLQTYGSTYWGSWLPRTVSTLLEDTSAPPALSGPQCFRNCMLRVVGGALIGQISKVAGLIMAVPDCASALIYGDESSKKDCLLALQEKVPLAGDLKKAAGCVSDCSDPKTRSKWVCTDHLISCTPFSYANYNTWFGGGKRAYLKIECEPILGTYKDVPQPLNCLTDEECVEGYRDDTGRPCRSCGLLNLSAARSPCQAMADAGGACARTDIRVARDPNAKYGPAGDVLPGQTLTYTITFENEGAGRAYGVYVVDTLPQGLDESTINPGGGQFVPSSRVLVWDVGELAPVGQPGSTGAVTFTVRVRDALPVGTAIINRATVYFPSVPEETPTNPVVNVVQRIAATPQRVQTAAGQSVAITLRGAPEGTLSYAVVSAPLYGKLSGSAPNLTYTPASGSSGLDSFTFRVSNAVTTSRPGLVEVLVNPSPADQTPPQVIWTDPAGGAVVGPLTVTPVYTDGVGPLYAPFVLIGFSEPLSATTLNTTSLRWTDGNGQPVNYALAYDAATKRVMLTPRQALRPGVRYRVTATRAVRDLAGIALPADYSFTFDTAGGLPVSGIYLPLVLRR